MTIEFNTFDDVQTWRTKLGLPFAINLSRLICFVLDELKAEHPDETFFDLRFEPEILSKSMRVSPGAWANRIANAVPFAILQGYQQDGFVILRATDTQPRQIFLQMLTQALAEHGYIKLKIADMPESYQAQPYVLLHRLRRKGINAQLRFAGINIIYEIKHHVQAEGQLHLPRRNGNSRTNRVGTLVARNRKGKTQSRQGALVGARRVA